MTEIRFGTDGPARDHRGGRDVRHDRVVDAGDRATSRRSRGAQASPHVLVGYDTRFLSRDFAQAAAEAMAAEGVRVSLAERFAPTPAFSYAVVRLGRDRRGGHPRPATILRSTAASSSSPASADPRPSRSPAAWRRRSSASVPSAAQPVGRDPERRAGAAGRDRILRRAWAVARSARSSWWISRALDGAGFGLPWMSCTARARDSWQRGCERRVATCGSCTPRSTRTSADFTRSRSCRTWVR